MGIVYDFLIGSYRWWTKFINWAEEVNNEGWQTFFDVIQTIESWTVGQINSMWSSILYLLSETDEWVGAKFLDMEYWVNDTFAKIGEVVQSVYNVVYESVYDYSTTVNEYYTNLIGASEEWVTGQIASINIPSWTDISEYINTQMSGLGDANNTMWDDLKLWFKGEVDTLEAEVKPEIESWKIFSSDPMQLLTDPMSVIIEMKTYDFLAGIELGFNEARQDGTN